MEAANATNSLLAEKLFDDARVQASIVQMGKLLSAYIHKNIATGPIASK